MFNTIVLAKHTLRFQLDGVYIYVCLKGTQFTGTHLHSYPCEYLDAYVPDDLCILFIFALAVPPLAEHDRGVHICWGECVWLVQERNHTEEDGSVHTQTQVEYR